MNINRILNLIYLLTALLFLSQCRAEGTSSTSAEINPEELHKTYDVICFSGGTVIYKGNPQKNSIGIDIMGYVRFINDEGIRKSILGDCIITPYQ